MAAGRKVKAIYDMGDDKTESKTFNNINPESDDTALMTMVNQLTGLQNRTVKSVECTDTRVVEG